MVRRLSTFTILIALAQPAFADWEVKRSGFDPALVKQYERALERNPDDRVALERLRDLYRAHKTLAALEAEYVERAARSHALTDLLVLAHLARARDDLPVAAERYKEAAAAFAADPRPRAALAEVRLKQGNARHALVLLRGVLTDTKEPARRRVLLRRLADLALAPETKEGGKEGFAEARGYLEELLRLSPTDVELKREIGELLASHGQEKEALAHFRAIAEREARDPARRAQTERRIGELCEAAGDDTGAREAYVRALTLVPRDHPLRREVLERWLQLERRRDELRALKERWEKEWPPSRRGFAEWEALGRLNDELGDGTAAESAYQRAIALEPHAIDTRRRLVATLDRAGRDADALAALRKLVAAAPGDARLKLELIERLHKGGTPEHDKEARALAQRVGRETRDPGVHGALAELYTRWGMPKEALAERELLVRVEPEDEAHLVDLGELYFQRGDRSKALETWRRILKARGAQEALLVRLADVLDEHDLHDDARPLYARALQLAPKSVPVRRAYASSLERARRDREALAIWEQLFEELATSPAGVVDIRARIGALTSRIGNVHMEASRYASRGAAARDPALAVAYTLLGAELWERDGKFDPAERAIDGLITKLKSTSPKSNAPNTLVISELSAEAWIARARLYRAKKDTAGAIRALKEAAQLSSARQRELFAQIAELSLSLYRDADAISYAERAAALGPGDAAAQERLAEIYSKKGSLDDAARAYDRAIALDPRKWQTRLQLARIQLRRGDFAKASTLYREVLSRVTEEEALLEAARRAIDIDELLGTLDELERVLQPLAFAAPDKKVYGELLLDLYDRMLPALDRAAQTSPTDAAALARAGQRALRPLLDLLVDANPASQRRAIRLLELAGHPAAAPPLIKLALTPRDPREIDLRVGAALAAASVADARAFEGLKTLYAQKEKHLRLAAVAGLEHIGDARALAMVTRALHDPDGDVQGAACLALARRRQESAAGEIVRVLRDRARSDEARAAAAWALGVMPHASHVDALIATLGEGGDEVERAAAWALAVDERAVPALLKAFFTQRSLVRDEAARALTTPAKQDRALSRLSWLRATDGIDLAATLAALGDRAAPSDAVRRPFELSTHVDAVVNAISDGLSRHRDIIVRTLDDVLGAVNDDAVLGPISLARSESGAAGRGALVKRLVPLVDPLVSHEAAAVRVRAIRLRVGIAGGRAWALTRLAAASLDERLLLIDAILAQNEPLSPEWTEVARTALRSREAEERRAGAELAGRLRVRDRALTEALGERRGDIDGFVREAARTALGSK